MTQQVKIDKDGAAETQNKEHFKTAGEEKCMNETEDVKERQRMGQRRKDKRCKEMDIERERGEERKRKREIIVKEN